MRIFARPSERHVKALLSSCGLPSEDLDASRLEHFLGCGGEAAPQGVVGLEIYGSVALLRSLAVAEASRGLGCGRRLVGAAERHAIENGVTDVYLLTTSANGFFQSLGYREVARDTAPDAIAATTEFFSLCPASATFMHKRVAD